jgi:hypothetical protein
VFSLIVVIALKQYEEEYGQAYEGDHDDIGSNMIVHVSVKPS